MVVVLSAYACASTYYVSSSAGNDSNSGTSAAEAWKTLGKVNGATFASGDRILLARGDVWRETLTPPSSGASGNPIVFDAYGSGAAPEITGYQALTTWTPVSGNVWSSPVTATGMNYVLFGTIWGTKQTSQGALAHDRDFFLYNNALYVYAPSNPATYYGTVAAILLTNSQLIYVNGKSWLTFQHIKVDWFDQFGVSVAGASDHLVFANMEADGMVPAGTQGQGFYVNASGPTDIKFLNDEAHLNYDGFRFDGTASAITLVNCKGYANRDGGLVDNTGGHVTYSYSHFYANNIAIFNSQDVQGAINGGNNLATDTAPAVVNFSQYPARVTFTIDDVGSAPGTEAYIDTLVPVFDGRGVKLSAAVSTGYALNTAELQSWLNDGHDINSHSWSHQYYSNTTAMNLRYTGTGTAATVSISGNRLTTAVTGGPGGENLNIDLTNAAYSSMLQLESYINGRGGYSVTEGTGLRNAVHTIGLADVAAHDIKTSYAVQFDKQRLVMDELTASKAWLQSNLTGLGNVKVYVYPDGIEDATTESYAVTAGYEGARGGLSMGLGSNAVYGKGVNLQNIVSLAAGGLHGLTAAQIDGKMGALVFKAQAWGVPYGLFIHINDLTAAEVAMLLDAAAAHGGTVLTNTQLADWLHSAQNVSGTTNYVTPATGAALNLRSTSSAPVVGKGSNQGLVYGKDLLGVARPTSEAWDIGAYQILWTRHGGRSGAGHFTTGATSGAATSENAYCGTEDQASFGGSDGPATLPQQCVYTALAGTPSNSGTVRRATTSTELTSAITAAQCGDVIELVGGTTYTGAFSFSKVCDRAHWITIRSDQIASPNFPAEGQQVTPCQINVTHIDGYPDYACPVPAVRMPTITNTVDVAPLTITGKFYRLIGLNVTKPVGLYAAHCLIQEEGSDHVILDRMLIHGNDWSNVDLQTHCGVSTNGTYQAVINSWIYDIDWSQPDGYGVTGATGAALDQGPLKLYNNLLAASSESWMFGGGYAASWPHDYEIRRNLSMKPLKWMIAMGAPYYNVSPQVKNLGEYKHGHRILYEDNVFINNWVGQADQHGEAMLLIPKNQANSNTDLFVNTSGTAVSCAKDASGTPCDAHTGSWGNRITSMSRSNGWVTVNGQTDGGWPYYHAGDRIILQDIPSQVVNGVNLNTFNGEWVMGCLNNDLDNCTDGYGTPRVLYFYAAGPDITLTTTGGGLAQDFTAQTCGGTAGNCRFEAPKVTYPGKHIASVQDSEHITTVEDMGVQTGVTQISCHPGVTPNAKIQDFTARYNYISHSVSLGLTMSNAVSQCADTTLGISRISIHDLVADDLQPEAWTRSNDCCGFGGTGPSIGNGYKDPALWPHDMEFSHLTLAGLRGWTKAALGTSNAFGFGVNDGFNLTYSGTTLRRVSSLVTIEFTVKSSVPVVDKVTVAGFTGAYADLNGLQTLTIQNPTNVQFVEPGSHADIDPAIAITSGTTGSGTVALYPATYYANITLRDSVIAGPVKNGNWLGNEASGGVVAGFQRNLCDPNPPNACTWKLKNVLVATAPYGALEGRTSGSPYPTTNPDGSSVCTLTGGCYVTDFSGTFLNWGNGLGDTSANDYTVTANYRNAASDGRNIGADITHVDAVKSAVLPAFTYYPLVISTSSLTACTNGVYCEQQLLTSASASTNSPNGFVQWHLTSGTLPAGMTLSNGDGTNTCKVNGSFSKTGPTGCVGWIWGTPTQSGSFPLTFQVEDAAHQKASVSLTWSVN